MACSMGNLFTSADFNPTSDFIYWQMFGGYNGFYREYPAFPYDKRGSGTCPSYDPRKETWY